MCKGFNHPLLRFAAAGEWIELCSRNLDPEFDLRKLFDQPVLNLGFFPDQLRIIIQDADKATGKMLDIAVVKAGAFQPGNTVCTMMFPELSFCRELLLFIRFIGSPVNHTIFSVRSATGP